MTPVSPSTITNACRRFAVPLICYYGVTLVLPLANGAGQSGAAFATHALAVLIVPLVLILLTGAVTWIAHALGRRINGLRLGRSPLL